MMSFACAKPATRHQLLKELPDNEFDVVLMMQVPLNFARQHKLVPIRKQDDVVLVAIHQALDLQPLDDVSVSAGCRGTGVKQRA